MDELPESDRLLEFPHPREQSTLVGHEDAEQRLLQAYLSGKTHHGWILGGTRGVGKATLAYRLARFVLKHPDPSTSQSQSSKSLFIDPEDPVFKRVASGGHSDLFAVRRAYDHKSKRLRREITAETVRKTTHFYTRTAGEGGWRICIIDTADDMNKTAANALLKILEEPPPRALFLLLTHAPGKLLPTLKSRCVSLSCTGLNNRQLATVIEQNLPDVQIPDINELAALSRGSPGRALALLQGKSWTHFQEFIGLLDTLPNADQGVLTSFAERLGARGAEEEFLAFFELLSDWLAAMIRDSATSGTGQSALGRNTWTTHAMPRTRLGAWSETWQQIMHSLARTNALNLDRKQTLLQAIHTIEETAAASPR